MLQYRVVAEEGLQFVRSQQHNAVYRGDRHSQFQTVALNVQRHIVWDTCLSHQVLES
jgi:hypothetical protein